MQRRLGMPGLRLGALSQLTTLRVIGYGAHFFAPGPPSDGQPMVAVTAAGSGLLRELLKAHIVA